MTTSTRSRRLAMNRLLLLFLVTAVLTMGLAWLLQVTPAQADGTIIQVPGDYPAIQQAIDAAQQGDEIRVQSGDYFEHLVVTKNLTLSGGWNVTFTEQTPDLTTINATGGRGLVVTGAPAAQWAPAAIARSKKLTASACLPVRVRTTPIVSSVSASCGFRAAAARAAS